MVRLVEGNAPFACRRNTGQGRNGCPGSRGTGSHGWPVSGLPYRPRYRQHAAMNCIRGIKAQRPKRVFTKSRRFRRYRNIERFYNRWRRHAYPGYFSPLEFENQVIEYLIDWSEIPGANQSVVDSLRESRGSVSRCPT